MKNIIFVLVILLSVISADSQNKSIQVNQSLYRETYRPQIHFSPVEGWMNDPNGMVYYNGVYHLFFQHYPDKSVWGPMHWGHTTSKDLIHWQQQSIALFPDSLGYIFSGSAVADIHNTSGFGKNGKIPLVAIFTNHNHSLEKNGSILFQNQSIAYSLDEGKKWIMTLATKDRITFYSSKNLKIWTKESEFGKGVGAHGGVWECPDLLHMDDKGKTVWVLTVSVNPGAPNGGSGTQYFIGKFDGHLFSSLQTDTKWMDYGTDNYAGVSWSNTGNRILSIGWMSNWQYADRVPTQVWRGATTIPRDITLKKVGNNYFVASNPIKEIKNISEKTKVFENVHAKHFDLTQNLDVFKSVARLNITAEKLENFSLILSNDVGEKLIVGFDKSNNNYYVDRSNSGKIDFEKKFSGKFTAPRISDKLNLDIDLIIDRASIELFADNGLSVMTNIFFPTKPYNKIEIQSEKEYILERVEFSELKSIW